MATTIDWLILFKQPFVVDALIVCLLAGLLSGLVGPWVVWRRLGQLGNAVAHASLTPIAISNFVSVAFEWFLFPFSLAISILLARLEEKKAADADSVLSVFYVGFMGLGMILLALSGKGSTEAIHVLFGDVLFVQKSDIILLSGVLGLAATFIFFFRRNLLLMVLNRELAAVEGVHVRALTYSLMALAGLTVAAGLKVMGAVLMTSLLMIPPLVTARFTSSLKGQLLGSVLTGFLMALLGFSASLFLDLPSGATIAAFGFLFFLVVRLLPKKR